MQYRTFTPDSPIVDLGELADRLLVVVSGEMAVYVENPKNDTSDTCTFKAGDFLGDFALLGEKDWGSSTLINVPNVQIEAYTMPERFVVCLVLEASAFTTITASHDKWLSVLIDQFRTQRLLHRREAEDVAVKDGQDQVKEALSFARSSHLQIKWGTFVSKLIKKRIKEGRMETNAADQMLQKLSLHVSSMPQIDPSGISFSPDKSLNQSPAIQPAATLHEPENQPLHGAQDADMEKDDRTGCQCARSNADFAILANEVCQHVLETGLQVPIVAFADAD